MTDPDVETFYRVRLVYTYPDKDRTRVTSSHGPYASLSTARGVLTQKTNPARRKRYPSLDNAERVVTGRVEKLTGNWEEIE